MRKKTRMPAELLKALNYASMEEAALDIMLLSARSKYAEFQQEVKRFEAKYGMTFAALQSQVETRVNGAIRQSGNTSLMIYSCAFLIRWISRMMTLYPGDVIATGTPAGVGLLVAGDTVEVSVGGIGVLRNPVQAPRV